MNLTFMISSIEDDPDTVNGGYLDPSFPFYYYHRATTGLACVFCATAIIHNLVVFRSYWKSDKKGFHYGFMCLLLSLVGNAFRFIVFVDPFSLMGLVDLESWVAAMSISDSFHVFSSMSSMVRYLSVLCPFQYFHTVQASSHIYQH